MDIVEKIKREISKESYLKEKTLLSLLNEHIGKTVKIKHHERLNSDYQILVFHNPLYAIVPKISNQEWDNIKDIINSLIEINYNRFTIIKKLDFLKKITSNNHHDIFYELPLFLINTYPFFTKCQIVFQNKSHPENNTLKEKYGTSSKQIHYKKSTDFCYYNFNLKNNNIITLRVYIEANNTYKHCPILAQKIYSFLDEINRRLIQVNFEKKIDKLEKLITLLNEGIPVEKNLHNYLNSILPPLSNMFNADIAFITTFSKNSAYFEEYRTSVQGIKFEQLPKFKIFDTGLTSIAFLKRKVILLNSKNKAYRVKYDNLKEVKSELLIPLIHSDHPLGILVLSSHSKNIFSTEDIALAETIAYELSNIISIKIFYRSLLELSKTTFQNEGDKNHFANEDQVYTSLAKELKKLLNVPVVCVWTQSANSKILKLRKSIGHKSDSITDNTILNNEKSISNKVINDTKRLIEINSPTFKNDSSLFGQTFKNLQNNDLYLHKEFAKINDLEECISIPIVVENNVCGVVNIYSRLATDFSSDETMIIRTIVDKYTLNLINTVHVMKIENLNTELLNQVSYSNINAFTLQTVHDVKHEFNSLKTDLSIIINLLSENKRKNENNIGIINQALSKAKNLSLLFNQLLLYKNSKPIKQEYYSLAEILNITHDLFAVRLKKITFDYKSIKDNVEVFCDKRRLQQVLYNLLINAIYSLEEKNYGKLKVWVTYKVIDQEYIQIMFNDNGQGISPYIINKIFDLSFTTKGNRGSGFGLAICKDIIENKFLGKINVVSDPGHKTTFNIKIKGRVI